MSGATTAFDVDGASATARLTPWDERALGMVTAEVIQFNLERRETIGPLIEHIEDWCRERQVRYVFGRIDAADADAKRALLEAGFALVECSLTLSRSGFAGLPGVPSGMRPTLRSSIADDVPELQRIAREDFAHGRFLEDPSIDLEAASQRTANWIGDLVEQGLAYTAESRGKIIGFHAERIDTSRRHAELLLTGTTSRYAMLALPLWVTALESLAARDVVGCSTLVSAANTSIVNLYARLGFRYDTALFGFRKYL